MKNFTSQLDSVFSRYPNQFRQDYIRYGQEFAKRIVEDGEHWLFDPVVSDWSCQLRAIWLCCFLKEKKIEEFSDEDFIFFGLARFLYEGAVFQDFLVLTVPRKTCSGYWPDSVFRLSKAPVRWAFHGEAKSLVARRVLDDLSRWLKMLSPEDIVLGNYGEGTDRAGYYEGLLSLFESNFVTAYSKVVIPIIPFFFGFSIVVSLAAYFKIPWCISLKKITKDVQGSLKLLEKGVPKFEYNLQMGDFERVTSFGIGKDVPFSIMFFSYSFCDNEKAFSVDVENFAESFNSIFNLKASEVDYLYAYEAIHALLPPQQSEVLNLNKDLLNFRKKYLDLANSIGIAEGSAVGDSVGEFIFCVLHINNDYRG